MKPFINETQFGSITIAGELYTHDVVIRLSGQIKKRKKKLSKAKYGTSHRVSIEEAKHIFEKGAKRLIIGTGQSGCVELSPMKPSTIFDVKDAWYNCFPHPRLSRPGIRPRMR